MARVYNPTSGPVVLDDEGHLLGGGEFAESNLTALVRGHIDGGRLIKVADTPETAAAKAASSDSKTKEQA